MERKRNNRNDSLFLSILFLFCLISAGCGRLNFVSVWRDREVVIDGKFTDWQNSTVYYDENKRVVVSLLNDKEYIYICLISRNREIEAKLIESGFTAWFDPDGGKNKVFGIRFPVGMKRMGMSIEDKDLEKKLEVLEGLQDKMELMIGPGKPPLGLSLDEARQQGIEAKIGREKGYFVYELKVPLEKSSRHPYAIEAKAGKPIGLGLEMQAAAMEGKTPSMFGSSGDFQLWAAVTLSSK